MNFSATLYVKDSYEAVELYIKAFGLTLGYYLSYEDVDGLKTYGLTIDDDYVPYKGYFHASLMCGDKEVFSVSGEGGTLTTGHNAQLCLNWDSEEAVRKAYSVLSEEAIYTKLWGACGAEVIDKHGIWWGLGL